MMKDRIISSIVILGGLAVMLLLRYFWEYSFDLIWLGITLIAINEMVNVVNNSKQRCYKMPVLIYPIVFALIAFVGYYLKLKFSLIMIFELLFLVLLMLGLIFIPMLNSSFRALNSLDKKKAGDQIFYRASITTYVLLYPAILMSLMLIVNHLVDFGFITVTASNNIFGLFAIIYILAMCMVVDTTAMFGGMIFKGKKLAPRISYNKTISGFITSIIFGVGASVGLFFIFNTMPELASTFSAHNLVWWHFVIIGLISALASAFGDLLASFIKRRNFVKDFGSLFPGHGGVVDRVNGVLINTLVVLVIFLIIF